ncbi:MAG: hypothetical protein WDO17_23610 [Alphaproteobacteria bacterium]
MSQPDFAQELRKAEADPWLPIESKLVGWSLGIGAGLLLVLAIVNHLFPVSV